MSIDPTILDQAYDLGLREGERKVLEGLDQWSRLGLDRPQRLDMAQRFRRWFKQNAAGVLILSADGPSPRPWRVTQSKETPE